MTTDLMVYGVSLAALLTVGALREHGVTSANLTVCGTLLLLYGAAMLKSNLLGVSHAGVTGAAVALNLSVILGSGFHPPRMYRQSVRSSEEFRRLDDAGASDDELAAFDAPSAGTGRTMALWITALSVLVLSRPGWFGL